MNGLATRPSMNVSYFPGGYTRRNPGVALGDRSRGMRGLSDEFDLPYCPPNSLPTWNGSQYVCTAMPNPSPLPNIPPVVISGTVNGQPVAAGGNNTQSAWLNLIASLGSGVIDYLNRGQAITIQRLQATGQLPGAGGTAANGQGLTGAVGQITTWASNNPLLVVAIGAGLFLFLAPSPRSGKR